MKHASKYSPGFMMKNVIVVRSFSILQINLTPKISNESHEVLDAI